MPRQRSTPAFTIRINTDRSGFVRSCQTSFSCSTGMGKANILITSPRSILPPSPAPSAKYSRNDVSPRSLTAQLTSLDGSARLPFPPSSAKTCASSCPGRSWTSRSRSRASKRRRWRGMFVAYSRSSGSRWRAGGIRRWRV